MTLTNYLQRICFISSHIALAATAPISWRSCICLPTISTIYCKCYIDFVTHVRKKGTNTTTTTLVLISSSYPNESKHLAIKEIASIFPTVHCPA